MGWMTHRKWIETKQQPGTAGPGNTLGCCLNSLHFLWAFHPIRPVDPVLLVTKLRSTRIATLSASTLTMLMWIYYNCDITAEMTSGPPPLPINNFGTNGLPGKTDSQ